VVIVVRVFRGGFSFAASRLRVSFFR